MLSNENKAGYFNVGCVAQYYQNIRERLQIAKAKSGLGLCSLLNMQIDYDFLEGAGQSMSLWKIRFKKSNSGQFIAIDNTVECNRT